MKNVVTKQNGDFIMAATNKKVVTNYLSVKVGVSNTVDEYRAIQKGHSDRKGAGCTCYLKQLVVTCLFVTLIHLSSYYYFE